MSASPFLRLSAFACFVTSGPLQALTLDNESATHSSLSGETITLTGRAELHLTGSGDPLAGCTVHLQSEDAWVFFANVRPSYVSSNILSRFRVSGSLAVAGGNVRVVQYGDGAVVIPHSPSFQPLEVFTGTHFSGPSKKLGTYTAYGETALGHFNDSIRSFILKRGYTATFARLENGTGDSVNYVAQDGDLEIPVLPSSFSGYTSFVRVFPWRWVGKKGSCDVGPTALNAYWHYNWSISQNSTLDWEYVGIRQQRYWPDLNQNWATRGVSHLLGYNEPDNPVEDAYTTLGNGSRDQAIASWPDLLATGLRVGAPAVTDGGTWWITEFINKANAANVRVDYVPVHYYRSYANNNDANGAANQMYNFLKAIHDVAQRPIWVTEFNNGANWTDNAHDPNTTQNRNVIQAMVNMMDDTPWIERYALYSDVEWFRDTHYDDGSLTPMGQMYRDHKAPIGYLQSVPNSGRSGNADFLFEGDFRDTSVHGNAAISYGTPRFVPGKTGTAVSLDGTDDQLRLSGRFGDSSDFSFAAWVKWNGGGNWQRIFDFGNGTARNMFLTPRSGDGTLRFAIKAGGSEQQLNAAALAPDVWTHVAVTIQGNTGKLFVNGTLANTNTGMTINPSEIGTEANYLGKSQWPDPLYNGLLDDVRIFNSAISDAQVTALANGSSAPTFVSDPLTPGSALPSQPFTGSLAASVSGGSGAPVFTKIAGPAWLAVATDGSLTGVPESGQTGPQSFLVETADSLGRVDRTTLEIPSAEAPGMVTRFPFNASLQASVGAAHGVATGSPLFSQGRYSNAIELDGLDDYVQLPFGVANHEEITIATWVWWDGGSAWQRIFDFGNGTTEAMFLTPRSGGNTLRFSIKDDGEEQQLNAPQLTANTWNHVAITLGGGTGRLYLNQQLVDTQPVTITPRDLLPATNFLGKSQYPDPLFDGRLDEFVIFNHALDPAGISALFTATPDAGTPTSFTPPTAPLGDPYAENLDPPGDGAVFSKASGPRWLAIDANGRISGVPGPSDTGTNRFIVRTTAAGGYATDSPMSLTVPAPAGLLAHHQFDGNTTDAVGSADGVTSGTPAYTAGLFDEAIDLDGGDDFVTLPNGIVNSVNDITVATRFRWDGGSAWQRIFDFGNNTSQYFFLTPSSGSGTLRFSISLGGTAGQQFLETSPPPVGEWTHVAITLSGDTGTLFVNGAAVASGTIPLNPSQVAPGLNYLGKSQFPDPYFNGAIDDFRIFDRALDAAEVHALAVPPAAIPVPANDYAAWAGAFEFEPGTEGPEANPDADLYVNAFEWLFGLDPAASDGNDALSLARSGGAELGLPEENTYLTLRARVRKDRSGISLVPEGAAHLDDLGNVGSSDSMIQAGPPTDDGEFEIITWYYEIPIADAAQGFARLRVVIE